METPKKFSMTECRSMPTPMVMDLKKMSDIDSGDVDPHLYSTVDWIFDVSG
jgi:hypothetical protein